MAKTKLLKLSVRGFAEVTAAEAKRKKTTLKKYQFPESEESIGRSNYYTKALSGIKHHHRGDHAFVDSLLHDLLDEAASETKHLRRAKLLNNHRALSDYLKHFGNRSLSLKQGKQLYYVFGRLMVSAKPDLVAEENGQLKLIKLNLSDKDFKGTVNAQLLHLMYRASESAGLGIGTVDVECLHVSSGSSICGPKSGFPLKTTLDAACQELISLWDAA